MALTTILMWDFGTVLAAVALALLFDKLRHVKPHVRPWEGRGTFSARRSRRSDFVFVASSDPQVQLDRVDWF